MSLTGVCLSFLSLFTLSNLKVNLPCWLKLWLGSFWLWWILSINVPAVIIQSNIKLCFTFSNVWDTADPKFHNIYINSLLLQLRSWSIWYVFLCHIAFKRFPNFEKHLVENLISFLMDCLCSFPSTIFLHPAS